MGLYNYSSSLPYPLSSNVCPIFDSEIEPYDLNPTRDGFEYICPSFSKKIVIGISGSLLATSLFDDMVNDKDIKDELIKKIKHSDDNYFAVTTFTINEIKDKLVKKRA